MQVYRHVGYAHNDRDHVALADGTAVAEDHLPRYFAKSGHVDADPKKVKKEGGGKGNWGTPGEEGQDYGYNFTNARRRSNSSSYGHAISDFKTKFETVEAEPMFEEEYHGAQDDDMDEEHIGLEKADSADSTSTASVDGEENAKKDFIAVMFSNSTAPASTALRNPRRRQRTGSDDSVAVRQLPKRLKRSGLTTETFKPLSQSANGHLHSNESSPAPNGCLQDRESQSPAGGEKTSLAIRNRNSKKPEREKRSNRGDSGIELTKNDTYAVKRLATTPIQFQEQGNSGDWHGNFTPSLGYAVATTQTQAFIWRYKQATNATGSSKPIAVQLLHHANSSEDPLPLGALVPSSPEPGLLIVMPVSGKVSYWDSLSNAASVDRVRQKQQAIQGTVAGLAAEEHISQITEAEPQGFLLTCTSGKIVHLTVADLQGRASIGFQILRNNSTEVSGIFGSLRNVFGGGGWLRDVVAVKAGNLLHKVQRECVIGTSKGLLQIWDMSWNGAHSLKYEADANSQLLKSIQDTGTFPRNTNTQYLQVLDLAFLPAVVTGQEVTGSAASRATRLLILTAMSGANTTQYNLHVVNITRGEIDVPVVHPVTCYHPPLMTGAAAKPHLLIPDPGQIAYVVFEASIVLVSLEEIEESPDSQLQTEARRVPDPFQDVLVFHKDRGFAVVGCAADTMEKECRDSACTFMIQGYGVIRVSVPSVEGGLTSADRTALTAETKLEQAVFYGSQQSLLDMSGRPEMQFATEDVSDAALRISRSITSSSSKHLSTAGPSMEQHLQKRAMALTELMKHLRKNYPPLDHVIRWKLLWEAERMAAAKAVWRVYNDAITHTHEREKILLYELVECISENDKTENRPEHHETDHVRHWLIKDVWRLEFVVPWAFKALDTLHRYSIEDGQPMSSAYRARLISQAYDLQLMVLETAYSFRQSNASLYGFNEDALTEGLLLRDYTEYDGMPQPWTSTNIICESVQTLAEYFQTFASDLGPNSSDEEGFGPPPEHLLKIAEKNARLIDVICKTHIERFQFLQASDQPRTRKLGKDLEKHFSDPRKALLKGLAEMGQLLAAIELGEKYRDMEAIAEVLESEIQVAQEELSDLVKTGENAEEVRAKIATCEGFVDEYFDKYGAAWANAYFARFVVQDRISSLLRHGHKQRRHLTAFLRNHPECTNFSWINEVSVEGNYTAAADGLRSAQKQADTLWAKKIQVSISRLATMAALSVQHKEDDDAKPFLSASAGKLEVLSVQEQLYDYLRPIIRRALNDTPARTEVVMEQYGKRFVKGKPALRGAMKLHIARLVEEKVLDAEDLADMITFMDEDGLDPDSDFANRRFMVALQVVRLHADSTGDISSKELLEKIIWRRCIIQDDWPSINRTELKDETQVENEAGATALFKTLREGFKSGFWDQNPPPNPSTLRGVGTTVSSLRTSSRYSEAADNALSIIAKDLEIEDTALETCIGKGRLEEWWKGIVDAAQASARNEADRDGEEESRRFEAEQERTTRDDGSVWGFGGMAKKSSAAGRHESERDEEGDVIMG
ncbi:MAG: hypothetical protein Q9176_002492 [Flavoplaca citrina]